MAMKTTVELADAIATELKLNNADVGFSSFAIADSIIDRIVSLETCLAYWISYGPSASMGTSLQLAFLRGNTLYDFEFAVNRQLVLMVQLSKIDSILADLGFGDDGSLRNGTLTLRAGQQVASYVSVGDAVRVQLLISFYHGLNKYWSGHG